MEVSNTLGRGALFCVASAALSFGLGCLVSLSTKTGAVALGIIFTIPTAASLAVATGTELLIRKGLSPQNAKLITAGATLIFYVATAATAIALGIISPWICAAIILMGIFSAGSMLASQNPSPVLAACGFMT
jgi:hypothetical protein